MTTNNHIGAGASDTKPVDFVTMRAGLEMRRIGRAKGGIQEQNTGGVHITNSGPKPTTVGRAPDLAVHSYQILNTSQRHRTRLDLAVVWSAQGSAGHRALCDAVA